MCGHAQAQWLQLSSSSTATHLKLVVQTVMQYEVVGQGDAVRLHGVVEAIVERPNVWVIEIGHLDRDAITQKHCSFISMHSPLLPHCTHLAMACLETGRTACHMTRCLHRCDTYIQWL